VYIYFIQDTATKRIKIGKTTNHPKKRLKAIQSCSPTELTLLYYFNTENINAELELHSYFSEYRVIGEWFEPAKKLLSFIKAKSTFTLTTPKPSKSLKQNPCKQCAVAINLLAKMRINSTQAHNICISCNIKNLHDLIETEYPDFKIIDSTPYYQTLII